ncbi:hypothetical protein ACF08N_37910, partial [Streptomyces sp. NPDC015127]
MHADSHPFPSADPRPRLSGHEARIPGARTGDPVTEPIFRKPVRSLDRVIIRFAGDSGDGMQLTGDRFTSETASFGN